MNFKAMRYKSISLNRIVGDKISGAPWLHKAHHTSFSYLEHELYSNIITFLVEGHRMDKRKSFVFARQYFNKLLLSRD